MFGEAICHTGKVLARQVRGGLDEIRLDFNETTLAVQFLKRLSMSDSSTVTVGETLDAKAD